MPFRHIGVRFGKRAGVLLRGPCGLAKGVDQNLGIQTADGIVREVARGLGPVRIWQA